MNDKTDKNIQLTIPLTFTIEKDAMQNFFDGLADKIAERVAVYLFTMNDAANQEQPAAAEPAADPQQHDDPNEPWGDEPETEEGADE